MVSRPVIALVATLFIEVPLVVLLYPGQRLRMGAAALFGNTVTNLFLNWVLPGIAALRIHRLVIGELTALVAEFAIYALVSRPRLWSRALLLAGLGNSLSFALGQPILSLTAFLQR